MGRVRVHMRLYVCMCLLHMTIDVTSCLACFVDRDCNNQGTCTSGVCACTNDYTGPHCDTETGE